MIGNLVIAGVPRSGTTALFRYLARHPELAPSPRKELDFFVSFDRQDAPASARERYLACFAPIGASARMTLEASPAYTREREKVAPRLRAVLPEARILLVFRDPVRRLHTYFRAEQERNGRLNPRLTFERYAAVCLGEGDLRTIHQDPSLGTYLRDGIKVGHYAEILAHYAEIFGWDRVLPLFAEGLMADPARELRRIAGFAGLAPEPFETIEPLSENRSKAARRPWLYRAALSVNKGLEPMLNQAPGIRRAFRQLHAALNEHRPAAGETMVPGPVQARLQAYYRPRNEALAALLGVHYPDLPLPAWLAAERASAAA